MNNSKQTRHTIRVNSSLFFILLCGLYSILVANLYLIQIRDTAFFTQLGSHQYTVAIKQAPPRASIIDRHHKPLAINNDCISAFILPTKLTNPTALKAFLSEHFPNALTQLATHTHKHFMYVQRKLSPEQIACINAAAIQDIQLLRESSRFYPIACTSPIIGKTDIDNNGILGIEQSCNTLLAGTPHTSSLQKDARSGYFYFNKEKLSV